MTHKKIEISSRRLLHGVGDDEFNGPALSLLLSSECANVVCSFAFSSVRPSIQVAIGRLLPRAKLRRNFHR